MATKRRSPRKPAPKPRKVAPKRRRQREETFINIVPPRLETSMLRNLAQSMARSIASNRLYDAVYPAPRGHWKTAGGSIIPIRDMEEEHLRNAVSFMARRAAHGLSHAPWIGRGKALLQTLVELIEECERRGFRV